MRGALSKSGAAGSLKFLRMERIVEQSRNFVGSSQLNLDEWAVLVRATSGGEYHVSDRHAFAGWICPRSVYGIAAAAFKVQWGLAAATDHAGTINGFARRRRDILANTDWYGAVFQVSGQCALTQNARTVQIGTGDVALMDGAQLSMRLFESGSQWLSIYLPRQSLISHLGFEPQTCLSACGGTVAARALRQLVLDGIGDEESTAAPHCTHMRLALYDLLGALFAPSNPGPVSRHADRLFARMRRVINHRCTDPDFGPAQVGAEMGISLRYVQKLLTARGCTCSELIYSIRLDHAARLLARRTARATGQHLSEIAYASGFRDYTHFARRFRDRFGCAPGAHLGGSCASGTRTARPRC